MSKKLLMYISMQEILPQKIINSAKIMLRVIIPERNLN